ncbi:hypothetical protein C8R46DRAFT_1041794 [Mycena filopes]|nr:hypothetical protein C8R46DRAFT_1041794 [Mycena filopes]
MPATILLHDERLKFTSPRRLHDPDRRQSIRVNVINDVQAAPGRSVGGLCREGARDGVLTLRGHDARGIAGELEPAAGGAAGGGRGDGEGEGEGGLGLWSWSWSWSWSWLWSWYKSHMVFQISRARVHVAAFFQRPLENPLTCCRAGYLPCVVRQRQNGAGAVVAIPSPPRWLVANPPRNIDGKPSNEDELREKARLRMAERRAGMKAEGVVSDSHAAGVKLANATYRARHRDLLAFKQRQRRQDAFISKYGRQAYQDRLAREKAKADAAMDAEWAAHMAAEEAERIAARSARVAARKLLTPSLFVASLKSKTVSLATAEWEEGDAQDCCIYDIAGSSQVGFRSRKFGSKRRNLRHSRALCAVTDQRATMSGLGGSSHENPWTFSDAGYLVRLRPPSAIRQDSPIRSRPQRGNAENSPPRNRQGAEGGLGPIRSSTTNRRVRQTARMSTGGCAPRPEAGPVRPRPARLETPPRNGPVAGQASTSSAATRVVRRPVLGPVVNGCYAVGGSRVDHHPALTHADLYLDALRPPTFKDPEAHHVCAICWSVKSHPVTSVGFPLPPSRKN